jgi:hypothetical protein
MFVTDHSSYDHGKTVADSRLVVDTRNDTKGMESERIVPCSEANTNWMVSRLWTDTPQSDQQSKRIPAARTAKRAGGFL